MARLPYCATKVVDASIELSVAQKWLWFAIWQLDRGEERAFISASLLARRKGVGITYVEQLRRELKALGLLGSGPRNGGAGVTWWPVLPPPCIPVGQKTTDQEVFALADRLDGFLRITKQGGADEPGHTPVRQAAHSRARPPGTPGPASEAHPGLPPTQAASPASVAGGGRVGREAPASQRCETTLPLAVRDLEEGEKAEEGARARANDEEGAGASSSPGNWREVMAAAAARVKRQGSGL